MSTMTVPPATPLASANWHTITACSAPPRTSWPSSSAYRRAPSTTGSPPRHRPPPVRPRRRLQPRGLAHHALSRQGADGHQHGVLPARHPGPHVLAAQPPAPLLAGEGGGGARVGARGGRRGRPW